MRALVLALLAVLPAAYAQQAGDLFERLDKNRDGHLSSVELQAEVAEGSGWIAIDRDQNGRISRAEFEPVTQALQPPEVEPLELVADDQAGLRGGYSAQRLIGHEVRDLDGGYVGRVRDVLVNSAGAVTGLVVAAGGLLQPGEFRVSWVRARIHPTHVAIPALSASAGGTRAEGPVFPRAGEWRLTEFLDDVVQIERGVRYAGVEDLIIAPWGEVRAVVVDAGPGGVPGPHAYPWNGERTEIGALRPFDYSALGIAPPPKAARGPYSSRPR